MSTYSLEFHEAALKEWGKLGYDIRAQFKRKLAERLISPHVISARLHGGHRRYKITILLNSAYRLVYEVNDNTVTVLVLAVGQRSKAQVYRKATRRC